MSFLTGSAKSQALQNAAVSGLQLQSSAYGKVIPIVYGTTRIAPNVIWYGDFIATPQSSSAVSGGKGGVTTAASGGKGGSSSMYNYSTALALGLCEGTIQGIGNVYVSKSVTTTAALGLSLFNGSYGQSTWGYVATKHSTQAVAYSGVAYVAASSYQLGNNAQLPNHNFEVSGVYANSLDSLGISDADPSLVIADLLTNTHYGAGLPAARLATLSNYQNYCISNGLWISPAYTTQAQSSSMLDDIAKATNSAFVWSSGMLNLVPYGDQSINANGYSYTAPNAALYDLNDDDFLITGDNQDAVSMLRKRPSDALNAIKVECLDRNNAYNPAVIEVKDQAAIEQFGLRQASAKQMHLFADLNAAKMSAQLQLQREQIRNIYHFTLDQRYVLLDPMDIVTLTHPGLGLNKQWVRIIEISENDDGSLALIAEEYITGTGNAPLYTYQANQGFSVNYNIIAPNANAPVIFEPTAQLSESLEVWIAASGGSLWGGCDVYISNDGNSYKNAGRITGSARTGLLTAALSFFPASQTGQTIDTGNTLAISLAQSNGQLMGGSQSDALNLATLCYVDGEYIAYQNAVLTGSNTYNLSWLIRGAYGTLPARHPSGNSFVRLDSGIFQYAFTQDYIGKTIYIKLVSFNIYGSGNQTIADVLPYAYTIQGTAFSSPLPNVANVRSSYVAGITQLAWDAVIDFRTVLYEIRKGTTWNGAQIIGRFAHPPINVQGNDTYWVAAYSQPVAGLQVYSPNPHSIAISGGLITTNVIASYDEAATGWSGSYAGSAVENGGLVQISATGNILTNTNYLSTADILYYGANIGNGSYEIASAHQIAIGRIAPCQVLINWASYGQKITDNILVISDYLNDSDILDYAASLNTDVYPEIALSQDGISWGAWQKYDTGIYSALKFKARMQLKTYDSQTIAYLTSFIFMVDVPDRDDHYINQAIASGGTTVMWIPDGASTPAAFNGGNGNALLPSIQVTILNALQGDTVVLSSVSLSSGTIQIVNSGSGVARNVNVLVQGY